MKRVLSILACAMFLFGCEQSVKNSTIPAKYVPMAKQYAGTYKGDFDGKPLTMNLEVADSGLVTLKFDSSILKTCEATAGALLVISVSNDGKTIKRVTFDLNRQNCDIDGSAIYLLMKDGKLVAQIAEKTHQVYVAGTEICSGGLHENHCHETPGSWMTVVDNWLEGSFVKQ